MTRSTALELDGVEFHTAGARILGPISWRVAVGSNCAIVGPNGSGKSTLLRLVTGYYFPTSGSVSIMGERLGDTDVHRLRRQIGVVDPAGPFQPDPRHTVLEVALTGFFGNLCLFFDEPTRNQVAIANEILIEVGLGSHRGQMFATLSTGEQRRALLARALVNRPSLLILDEPTAGLDILARETMLATVDLLSRSRPELTVLTVTHHLEELLLRTGQVLLLRDGRTVAEGSPTAVLTADHLRTAFGCPVEVRQIDGRWSWNVRPAVWRHLIAR